MIDARQFSPRAWILRLVTCLLGFGVQHTSHAELLWRVTGGAAPAYLLGAIHFGEDDMYPLSREALAAFDSADSLVVEVNILAGDSIQGSRVIDEIGRFADGVRLSDVLSAATHDAFVQYISKLGMAPEVFDRQRPWLAALTLTSIELNRQGYSERLGVDRYLLENARGGQTIIELENALQQLSLFANLSADEQDGFLLQTVDDLASAADYFAQVVQAWRTGDAARMDALIRQGFIAGDDYDELYRLLITDRNRTMTAKITALLQDGRRHFISVGAGHLVGGHGIAAALRERGFTVQQLGVRQ